MPTSPTSIKVYFEQSDKRTLTSSLDWPGWCRIGKDESSALQNLLDHAPRYALVLKGTRLGFTVPKDISVFKVVERFTDGGLVTEMGIPEKPPKQDSDPVDAAELKRLTAIYKACWRALEAAAEAAKGKELTKGPRGGGRELDDVLRHVLDSQAGYLRHLIWKLPNPDTIPADEKFDLIRDAALQALAHAATVGVPAHGPRGGKTWSARYFVRRSTWHILDHAWEIENRIK